MILRQKVLDLFCVDGGRWSGVKPGIIQSLADFLLNCPGRKFTIAFLFSEPLKTESGAYHFIHFYWGDRRREKGLFCLDGFAPLLTEGEEEFKAVAEITLDNLVEELLLISHVPEEDDEDGGYDDPHGRV